MELEYLNTIDTPPQSSKSLHSQAASNDDPTVNAWRDIWIKNMKANHDLIESFCDNGIGKIYGEFDLKPCILAGSGPSLRHNIKDLKEKGDIPLISCLHNFHFMIDNEIDVNYFVTLDAGEITIPEISEGGKEKHEYYLDKTKDHTLLAFIGTSPNLIKAWKGKILWFNCPIPDQSVKDAYDSVERFHNYVANGGNVLGAAVYIAKAYLGANPIAYIGADFAFGYDKKFHGWDSSYDAKIGKVMRTIDCYGNKVYTWQSYYNFKCWHDSITLRVPGEWINCTEGGTWGVYPEGLIKNIKHKPLKEFIHGFTLYKAMKFQADNPKDAAEESGVEGIPPHPKLFFS
jgi:hypothetical protein